MYISQVGASDSKVVLATALVGPPGSIRALGLGCREGFGYRASGFGVWGLKVCGFRAQGFGFQV